jgi:uncharacterized Zn finger protein (UPF0148 family)
MHCPTCNSPLPVGAMFCGECGRAVTSADVAAAAARRDESGDAGTQAEPPAWQLRQPPRPAASGDAPWWVRDRRGEQDPGERPVDRTPEEAPPAWVVPAQPAVAAQPPEPEVAASELVAPRPITAESITTESIIAESITTESITAESITTESITAEPAAAAPVTHEPLGPVDAASADDVSVVDREAAARARQVDAPPAEPTPAPAPVPLREPSVHQDNGPRPTSAPLWTASFAPLPTDDEVPTADDQAAEPPAPVAETVDEAPHEVAGHTTDPTGEHATASEGDHAVPADAVHAASQPDGPDSAADGVQSPSTDETPEEDAARPTEAAEPTGAPDRGAEVPIAPPVPLRLPAPTADAVAGDTAPLTPLPRVGSDGTSSPAPAPTPAPVPLVEPGQQKVVEHCTHCGALLDEDDIFCPECGAVVQSVALSFTGPIAPLPPEWRPGAPASAATPTAGAHPARVPESQPGPDLSDVWRPREPRRGETAPEPDVAAEPPVGRGAIPGLPAEDVRKAAPAAPPELPPVPAAAAPSALSGLLAHDARSRLATDDDVDETRLVRRGPAGTEYLLQFSTGESVTVDGPGLIGRAPSPQPGERFDHLVRIVDPGKSVSKTHLEFGQELGALWVSDRWSGNGTVVRPEDQPARRVEPGTRVRVARGTRVEIGEQFFVVS